MTAGTGGSGNTLSGVGANTPILMITTTPQPVPIGNGSTLINDGTNPINLSQDQTPTAANTTVLQPNGASIPFPSGPIYAWVSSGSGSLIVIPQILNIFNPNVLTTSTLVTVQSPKDYQATGGIVRISPAFIMPPVVRTLILDMTPSTGSITNILVQANTGMNYYNQPPYLTEFRFSGPNGNKVIIPITPSGADVGIDIVIDTSDASPTVTLAIYGDSDQYDESLFYNGTIQQAQHGANTTGATALVAGPCRLLTASVEANAGIVFGEIGLAAAQGSAIVRADSVSASDSPTVDSVSFPPNTILPLGSSLYLYASVPSGGNAQGMVSYAYP